MKRAFEKYIPAEPINIVNRQWPSMVIKKAPIWCSVDLRDGNQALVEPMNLKEKLLFFKTLVDMGFKEIEVGFPSASETEYTILRTLIEENLIPDDVTIQVLVQSRAHLIEKTFEAIKGAKNVIIHFYNSTSTLQRKVVFKKDMQGIIDIAVDGAKLIAKIAGSMSTDNTNIRFEYSPESFSGTEMDNAVEICEKVIEAIGATPQKKLILNLPATVEGSTPNVYADQIEYFIGKLKSRDSAIISVHPHNDRGTAVAATELALLAGAERVEGTLFGNGERTGNADIVTIALNMYTQGVDPELVISNVPELREVYENTTKMKVHERHPYSGDLVFTAFSGSHQDAINKGINYMKTSTTGLWEIPYLPIDPADVGREYEPIIRINSQSGKGGSAYILQNNYGFNLPKSMHPEFGVIVQKACEICGKELSADDIYNIFKTEYLQVNYPYNLKSYKLFEQSGENDDSKVIFEGIIYFKNKDIAITGEGNGPIDAFFNAITKIGINNYKFVSYSEHALTSGADSKAISYIELKTPNDKLIYGVGIDNNISLASIKGVICAINRSSNNKTEE